MSVPNHRARPLMRMLKALEQDLIDENGPRISTMRNYRYAIAVYAPDEEFELREGLSAMSEKLGLEGWFVHTISLQRLVLDRLKRELGEQNLQRIVDREKLLTERGAPDRALNYLNEKATQILEGPDGLAADIVADIERIVTRHPERAERMVVFITRAGSIYPFMRPSALLKYLDGRTHNVAVIVLYPGNKDGDNGLEFMGILPADRDYRPRIYTSESLKL